MKTVVWHDQGSETVSQRLRGVDDFYYYEVWDNYSASDFNQNFDFANIVIPHNWKHFHECIMIFAILYHTKQNAVGANATKVLIHIAYSTALKPDVNG